MLVQLLEEQCTEYANSRQKSQANLATLRICIWALSNFCRGSGSRDSLDMHLNQYALPIITTLLECFRDPEILMDAAWALSRTLRGITETMPGIVVDHRLAKALMQCLEYHLIFYSQTIRNVDGG